MECSVCTMLLFPSRSPSENVICANCADAGRSIIAFINHLQTQKVNHSPFSPANSLKQVITLSDAEEWISELSQDLEFLTSSIAAYKEQIHSDILVFPGDCAYSIPAHKAILATRSEIFKIMLDSDECKAGPSEAITIPDLKYQELESLLEFLYCGTLAPEKLEKHVYTLMLAAHKYAISHLEKHCERYMQNSLNPSNVLDIVEIAETCSNQQLMEATFDFLVENLRDIVSSPRFEAFAFKRPNLSVQLLKALSKYVPSSV